MHKHQTIDVENLVVNEENPRFEAVSTEDDALYSILADQKLGSGNKILNLARDIALHGLNASEQLIVSPIDGTKTYLVREGNRRITAIKLSLNSERIPEDFRKLAPQFKELEPAIQTHRHIECYVCDDENEIRRLLLLRHGGESSGVGTVKWNSIQTARFNEEGNPQTTRALSFVRHLQEDYGQSDLWKAAAAIPPTNLGRLITTPEVRRLLNIDLMANDAYYRGAHDELLLNVLSTLKEKGVGVIYDKEARVRLVKEAIERLEPDRPKQTRLPFDTMDINGGEDSLDGGGKDTAYSETECARSSISTHNEIMLPDFQSAAQPQTAEGSTEPQWLDVDVSGKSEEDKCQSSETLSSSTIRRKPVSHSSGKRMFGHALRPRGTESNSIYRGIDWIDEQYLKHPDKLAHLLPILGFSLRLLMETVAREYFASIGDDRGDKALSNFLKEVAKPAISAKIGTVERNNMALASEWIDGMHNFEALFAKWAHGTLAVDRSALVRQADLVALVIDEVRT